MSAQSHERRRFQRIPFEADVELTQGRQCWPAKLHDLSLKGLLVSRPDGWEADDSLPLQASLCLAADIEVRMTVSLAHQNGGLLGLCCREIDLDSITHLRRLIALNLGSSELLERELSALLHG
ncbi:PilZ domain-containing protein [Pseudomonas stutzeri]|nr:PilZ domain-containing protein [Stutzerimonas stutzeri]